MKVDKKNLEMAAYMIGDIITHLLCLISRHHEAEGTVVGEAYKIIKDHYQELGEEVAPWRKVTMPDEGAVLMREILDQYGEEEIEDE